MIWRSLRSTFRAMALDENCPNRSGSSGGFKVEAFVTPASSYTKTCLVFRKAHWPVQIVKRMTSLGPCGRVCCP